MGCEENKTRMDDKLRQGYKNKFIKIKKKKKKTYDYTLHNNTLLPNNSTNNNMIWSYSLQHTTTKCDLTM